jgi:MOSC domain-containing protein YiiM
LNCCVIHGGEIHVGDAVQLLGEHECEMNLASH